MHVRNTTTLAFMEDILFVLTFKEEILEVNGMMVPIICMESRMVCNLNLFIKDWPYAYYILFRLLIATSSYCCSYH